MLKFIFTKTITVIGSALLLSQANFALAQQVCPTNMVASAPNSRYTVLTNTAEVRDNATGLVWQRCALGQSLSGTSCSGTARVYNFNQALIAANGAGVSAGYAWRLPNINEIKSLVEWACHSPSLNVAMFPDSTLTPHWTSTSDQDPVSSTSAWSFNFSTIATNNLISKATTLPVRLVRFN